MAVDSVTVNQSANGVECATIAGASPTWENINAHVNNQPTTGIVDVATGLTRPTSPASSSQFATRLLGNAHQLLLTTTTTQMTTVTMTAKTMYCRFVFASSMQRRRRDSPLQLNNRLVQKHVPLLIVAEVICERCLQAGISVNDGLGRRAPIVFVCVWRPRPSNQRRFYFHSFDNEAADPVDQFLDFLTHHGPKKAHTVCIAHNGGKYDFHLILEALHRRNLPPKRLCTTGLKIYSMRLSGSHQRRVTFKDSINYFFCELDALVTSFNLPQHQATVKPFFPYLYIQRQHLLQRLDTLPAREFYSPDTMKAEKTGQIFALACRQQRQQIPAA
ncbi:hypothetical protein niasHT_027260 [Heterodera trifolii]|uniref:DNA-directed DNA polymerase n=1 Tax=Heterodera trifolii TaxID=157864 RepID=A0ABD2JTH8_9BILA